MPLPRRLLGAAVVSGAAAAAAAAAVAAAAGGASRSFDAAAATEVAAAGAAFPGPEPAMSVPRESVITVADKPTFFTADMKPRVGALKNADSGQFQTKRIKKWPSESEVKKAR